MKRVLIRVAVLAALLPVATEIPVRAQAPQSPAAVTLPATGSFARGGEFNGTITINRFEQRGNRIVAIGMVRGLLSRHGRTLGAAVAGEVTWPVAVRAGGQLLVGGPARESGADAGQLRVPIDHSPLMPWGCSVAAVGRRQRRCAGR